MYYKCCFENGILFALLKTNLFIIIIIINLLVVFDEIMARSVLLKMKIRSQFNTGFEQKFII